MELMTMGILVHIIMLAQAGDELKSFLLAGDGDPF